MTQRVNPSPGRPTDTIKTATALDRATTGGGPQEGYVVTTPTRAATEDSAIDETVLNAFDQTSSGNSFDVTIAPGEAFVGGSWLCIDTSTTVTLASNTTGQTVAVGWDATNPDTVLLQRVANFTDSDPYIPLWTFATDGSGVTSVTDERRRDYTLDVDGALHLGGDEDTTVSHDGTGARVSGAPLRLETDLESVTAGTIWDQSDGGIVANAVNLGRGLESDGTGSIQFNEDVDYTFSQPITVTDTMFASTFSAVDGTFNGFNGGQMDINSTTTSLDDPNNDTRFDADGSTTALIADDTTPVTIRDSVQAGTAVEYTAGTTGTVGLPGASLDVAGGDISDSVTGTTVWDTSAGEVPDSALGTVDTSTLSADSVTVTAGDGLTNGGTVTLGGSVSLDIAPADFAGQFISDDGADNLQVDIGRGLEADGTGSIQFDEDTSYSFTASQTFEQGLTMSTGQSIDDGSGNKRFRVLSDRTEINDEQNQTALYLKSGAKVGINAYSGTPFVVRDKQGSFDVLTYAANSSAPGILRLRNADLDLSGNSLTSSSGRITLSTGGEDLTISQESAIKDENGVSRFRIAPNDTAVFDNEGTAGAFYSDTLTRFSLTSSHVWEVFDSGLNDQLVQVQPSPDGTAPGTVTLTNATLDGGNNSLVNFSTGTFTSDTGGNIALKDTGASPAEDYYFVNGAGKLAIRPATSTNQDDTLLEFDGPNSTVALPKADLDMLTNTITFQGTGSQSIPTSAITWPDQGGGSDPTLTVSGGGEVVAYDDDGNKTLLT